MDWLQWLVPVALVGAMFLMHRGGGGCCGPAGHTGSHRTGRGRRDERKPGEEGVSEEAGAEPTATAATERRHGSHCG